MRTTHRVLIVSAAVAVLLLLVARPHVEATLDEPRIAVETETRSDAPSFVLNGQRVRSTSTTSRGDLRAALDAFAIECGGPVIRAEDPIAGEGYVACAGAALRYVHARRDGDRTRVSRVQSDGAFDAAGIVPRDGADAPGEDVAGVPRPIGSRRTLSFGTADGTSRVVVYASRGVGSDAIERAMLAELRAYGLRTSRVIATRGGERVVSVGDGARRVWVVFGERADGRASTVLFESLHGSPQSPDA